VIVIVTGGRDYADMNRVCDCLDALNKIRPITVVRHGACVDRSGAMMGADRWADVWAVHNGVEVDRNPADWGTFGYGAGPMRNRDMAWKEPRASVCLAFPGGRGTRNMIGHANKAGILVIEVAP
jgi:hypothetical protein